MIHIPEMSSFFLLAFFICGTTLVSGQQLLESLGGRITTSLSWSPTDGAYLATGGESNEIRIWSVQQPSSNWQIVETLVDPTELNPGAVNSIEWSHDGSLLACGRELNIQIWLTTTTPWTLLQVLTSGYIHFGGLAWSPDGSMLASASFDGLVFIWSTTSWQILQTLNAHTDWVYSVAWSPTSDGSSQLATASQDTTIKIWSSTNWEQLRVLTGHGTTVQTIDWSPNGSKLASGGLDIKIWSTTSWQVEQTLKHVGVSNTYDTPNSINQVAWSPDSSRIASATQQGLVLWDTANWNFVDIFFGNDFFVYGIYAVDWRLGGTQLASGGQDARTKIWEIAPVQQDSSPAPISVVSTDRPSSIASTTPSTAFSEHPSERPPALPTPEPSFVTSTVPSTASSEHPSALPTPATHSFVASTIPSTPSSEHPSALPTPMIVLPSEDLSMSPTTGFPSHQPSSRPIPIQPIEIPSATSQPPMQNDSMSPTISVLSTLQPSHDPSRQSSHVPTRLLSVLPSSAPSKTMHPSSLDQPSAIASDPPSIVPSFLLATTAPTSGSAPLLAKAVLLALLVSTGTLLLYRS